MLKRTFHLYKRLMAMGLICAAQLLFYRFKKAVFITRWRNKKKHFTGLLPTTNTSLTVTILGLGEHTFNAINKINWHQDFYVSSSPLGWCTKFFADITIPSSANLTLEQPRQADIKVPWELSRMHCLHNQSTAVFTSILAHWMEHNPFPYGVNWLNPMEVGIRAINIIIALQGHRKNLSSTELATITTLLEHHALFIENCWEVSDRPNNHYLADLVGYLYLCCNLNIKKYYRKRLRVWQWCIKNFKKQLLEDGSDYEGSTAYHRLVTELLVLALQCAKQHNLPIPASLLAQHQQMQKFLSDCTDQGGNLALIGDNDSGSILPPAKKTIPVPIAHATTITYPHFGISIIKTPRLHFTFRHATYRTHQPSGHFHTDILGITLSIDGIPFFIDPGTYLYTAHPAWRNQLRSASAHNIFMPTKHVIIKQTDDLFQLNRMEWSPCTMATDSTIIDEYLTDGVALRRECQIAEKEIKIVDCAQSPTPRSVNWWLHLGKNIEVESKDPHTWLLLYKQQPRVRLHSFLALELKASVASDHYGSLAKTWCLFSSAQTQESNKVLQQLSATLMR